MRKRKDKELDLHIWMKPETENMTTLFTVRIGNWSVCIDMPVDVAIRCIRGVLEDMEDED